MRHPVISGLYVGTPLISLFVLQAPLVTTGVTGAVTLALLASASTPAFLAIVGFLTASVPKAGFILGGLPLPVMLFVLLGGAVLLRQRAAGASHRGTRLAALALVWLVYRLMALYFDGGALRDVAALAGWYGLPVVLLMLGPPLGSLRRPTSDTWTRSLEVGVLFACGFSVVQQLAGIDRTAVPGITRAVGADYSSKPLLFEGGSKIPSTYQNGNILGVITATFFIISADHVLRGKGTRRDFVMMAATAVATLLSGSRTAVIGLAFGLVVLLFRSGLRRQTVTIAGLASAVAVVTLYLSPALSNRLVGTKASDPALAQRTEIWSRFLDTSTLRELVTGGSAWARPLAPGGLADGLLGGVQQVGLIGMGLFLGLFLLATSPAHLRRWRLLMLPVAVSFAVDSAYLVFPTLFLPLARMFAPIDPQISRSDSDDLTTSRGATAVR